MHSALEAARSGKLIALAIGNIHAGEVCGKEALPILAREILATPHHPLLEDMVFALAPIYNADGNERVSKQNRPGQIGPEEGMGQRANARGLDLNRDFIKLEAPETRALVQFFNTWKPHLFIDTHTTNGSYHRYTITYEGPKNPAGDSQDHRVRPLRVLSQAHQRVREEDGVASLLSWQPQSRPHPVDNLPGRGTLRHDVRGHCGTGWPSSPRLTRTLHTRTACWRLATSCASA